MPGEFMIEQSEVYAGEDWWKWSVWIEGQDEALNRIEFAEWTLHPTFPNPVRRISDRATKFRLDTGGWGVFPIFVRLQLKDGQQIKLRHQLQLHYPDGKTTAS